MYLCCMKYNGEFKMIDSKEKAYLLGLIMADGCLFYNVRAGSYQVKIKLKKADKDLLYDIHSLFPFFIEPKLEKRSWIDELWSLLFPYPGRCVSFEDGG